MQPLNQDKDYWELDYDWSKRGGQWNESTDVMLIGSIDHDACCAQALLEWVELQMKDFSELDGGKHEIFYAGGVQGYLEHINQADSQKLYLHSRGEDAFDSLSYYSQQIARFIRSKGCTGNITWTEARHDRQDHQLRWP